MLGPGHSGFWVREIYRYLRHNHCRSNGFPGLARYRLPRKALNSQNGLGIPTFFQTALTLEGPGLENSFISSHEDLSGFVSITQEYSLVPAWLQLPISLSMMVIPHALTKFSDFGIELATSQSPICRKPIGTHVVPVQRRCSVSDQPR